MPRLAPGACQEHRPPPGSPTVKTERILVPIDFSDCSRLLVAEAANLARRLGAGLTLLHVVQPPDGMAADTPIRPEPDGSTHSPLSEMRGLAGNSPSSSPAPTTCCTPCAPRASSRCAPGSPMPRSCARRGRPHPLPGPRRRAPARQPARAARPRRRRRPRRGHGRRPRPGSRRPSSRSCASSSRAPKQTPWTTLAWRPRVHPVFFVHRVADLAPGLHLLARDGEPERLRPHLDPAFAFAEVEPGLPLRCLQEADVRALAQGLNHFTAGGPVEDDRLQTLPPHAHRAAALAEEDIPGPPTR